MSHENGIAVAEMAHEAILVAEPVNPPAESKRGRKARQALEMASAQAVEMTPEEKATQRTRDLIAEEKECWTDCITLVKEGLLVARTNNLQAGKRAARYVAIGLILGKSREKITSTLEADLNRDDMGATTIKVNDLIKGYQVYALLGEENTEMPYGCILAWGCIVQRKNDPVNGETWYILPGMEEECRAAFAKAMTNGIDAKGCRNIANDLDGAWAKKEKEAADAKEAEMEMAREQAAKDKEMADEAQRLAKVNADRAAAEVKASKAKEDEAAQVVAVAVDGAAKVEAQKALEAAQQETMRLAVERARLDNEKKKADKEAKDKERADKAAQLELNRAERDRKAKENAIKTAEERKATAEKGTAPANLVKIAKAATAKDCGQMATDFLVECEAPTDALIAMLEGLDGHKGLCKIGHQIVKAGLDEAKRLNAMDSAA